MFDESPGIPSGLPTELRDWLALYTAADVLGARLQRLSLLLRDHPDEEDDMAQESSSIDYSIPTDWKSDSTEGKGRHIYIVLTQLVTERRSGGSYTVMSANNQSGGPWGCVDHVEPLLVQACFPASEQPPPPSNDITIQDPASLAPQMPTQPQTCPAAHGSSESEYAQLEPLRPRASPLTAVPAADIPRYLSFLQAVCMR